MLSIYVVGINVTIVLASLWELVFTVWNVTNLTFVLAASMPTKLLKGLVLALSSVRILLSYLVHIPCLVCHL